ncbi:LOW QUALITY PROTEIN: hypothetical protein PanWU01x14_045340 [Parasponia andersonii]|uniref:Uncharacterized protein n=1 Tax=Parasponia andersonii TaxID=3476 RepID=A0A2P5DPG7_PARAD|nr:LOW QUALITY PROTEIN: hypothetical protein PanWU01x14_045340 [Parasponia andersonii]
MINIVPFLLKRSSNANHVKWIMLCFRTWWNLDFKVSYIYCLRSCQTLRLLTCLPITIGLALSAE